MSAGLPEEQETVLDRRRAVGGLALAGLGALLAACRVDPRSTHAQGPAPNPAASPASTVAIPIAPSRQPVLPDASGSVSSTPGTSSGGAGPAATPAAPAVAASGTSPVSQPALYAHLLRRAGFGTAPGELDEWQKLSWADAVDKLVDNESIPNQALEDRLSGLKLDLTKAADIQRWWVVRMIYTARPLEEKMTLFWHGLLTSALTSAKPPEMLAQNRFFRAHALDPYGDILKGITRDPAMMRFLNTAENKKGHANENYARELMELFTMGPGNYSETDVRESARAFTGLTARADGSVALVKAQHDDGTKTFLGQTGNFGPDEIIDIILQQPATAPFVATKLLHFFLSPNPSPVSVDAIAGVLRGSQFSIKAAVRALFNLDEFKDPATYRALIKSPAEYVAGMLRQLGAETDARGAPAALAEMGQILFDPPNVAGWPGGAAWLNSGTWLSRLNFANAVTTSRDAVKLDQTRLSGAAGVSSAQFVEALEGHLLDGNLDSAQRQVLDDFANQGATGTADAAWFDGQGRATLYLLLALPEYHLN